jgi:hypothetical protein
MRFLLRSSSVCAASSGSLRPAAGISVVSLRTAKSRSESMSMYGHPFFFHRRTVVSLENIATAQLFFRCPWCTADLTRKMDAQVERAIIRYRCPRKHGGCDGTFTLWFDLESGLRTEPPQRFPFEHSAAEKVDFPVFFAR